ncbi:MAG: ORF6N domain-containing protein [Candidatus Eisenbacteria bacterium]
MASSKEAVRAIEIDRRILFIRGQKVIVDADLAELYGVPTKRLNEQVKRNKKRFPDDFMFRLTKKEKDEVVANCDHLSKLRFSRTLPRAFTEHGAIMAATVLNSESAIDMSVFVVRAFIRLRRVVSGNLELARRFAQLERRLGDHDEQISELVILIRSLIDQTIPPKRRRIGFI